MFTVNDKFAFKVAFLVKWLVW